MFTHKDLEFRSIFVINCIDNKSLRVESGSLLLEDTEKGRTLTKLPFQKILALFVIGHITVTTALIDKCTKYGIPIVVMKPNLRPVFFFSVTAEANFEKNKNEYRLKREKNADYCKMFYDVLIEEKMEVFNYIRDFYRCFMQRKSTPDYPQYLIK